MQLNTTLKSDLSHIHMTIQFCPELQFKMEVGPLFAAEYNLKIFSSAVAHPYERVKRFCFLAVGDGRMGYPEEAPYDAIHVGAAAPVVPQAVSLLCFVCDSLISLY